jgi:hypothetical protein
LLFGPDRKQKVLWWHEDWHEDKKRPAETKRAITWAYERPDKKVEIEAKRERKAEEKQLLKSQRYREKQTSSLKRKR